jgi:hypothetical protein
LDLAGLAFKINPRQLAITEFEGRLLHMVRIAYIDRKRQKIAIKCQKTTENGQIMHEMSLISGEIGLIGFLKYQ